MTRKDYIAIAEALRFAKDNAVAAVRENGPDAVASLNAVVRGINGTAEYIANAMQDDNPRFDREHFLAVVRGERELTSRPKRKPIDYGHVGYNG